MIIIMGYSNLTPKAVENDQGMRQVLVNIKLWNLLIMIWLLLVPAGSGSGDRKNSFYCGPGGAGSLIKHNGSRLSILSDYREMQLSQSNEKKFGSRLSVFSGPR